MSSTDITRLAPEGVDFFEMDFNEDWCAANGDTLTGTPTFTSKPDGLVFGTASVANNVVTVQITAPAAPVSNYYEAICTADTQAGRRAIKSMLIPIG